MSALVQGAASIARRICSESIEHGGRCTWICPRIVPGAGARPEVIHVCAGPELYDGTAGISLALAEVAAVTGERGVARTAQYAMAHALSRVSDIPPSGAAALHSGRIGVALAAARVGTVLGIEEFTTSARRIAADVPAPAGSDLISGLAGTVLGLLSLGDLCEAPDLLTRALELGGILVDAPPTGHAGLAHGESGPLLAFAELAARSDDGRFPAAMTVAATRERSAFDPGRRDWRDLRDDGEEVTRFSPGWCAGSAGIALARTRARLSTGDAGLHAEGALALDATRHGLEREALLPGSDWCLCHGIAGLLEAIVDCEPHFAGREADREYALDLAGAAVDRYERPGGGWPSRVPGLEWHGLMQGIAGVALLLARLHSPLIPSVLAPGGAAVVAAHERPALRDLIPGG